MPCDLNYVLSLSKTIFRMDSRISWNRYLLNIFFALINHRLIYFSSLNIPRRHVDIFRTYVRLLESSCLVGNLVKVPRSQSSKFRLQPSQCDVSSSYNRAVGNAFVFDLDVFIVVTISSLSPFLLDRIPRSIRLHRPLLGLFYAKSRHWSSCDGSVTLSQSDLI